MLDLKPPARSPEGTLELITTHLEMRSPPRTPRVAITGRSLSMVHARNPPVHFYRYLYNTVGSPYLWWQRREMADAELAAIIHDPRVELHVLMIDGVPAGMAELDRRPSDGVELALFGLIPEFIGQGLGLPFLARAVEPAWKDPNIERVTVHACSTDHPRALLVYQRLGFSAYDEVREIINDPRDRGLFPEHPGSSANPGDGPTPVPSANAGPPSPSEPEPST